MYTRDGTSARKPTTCEKSVAAKQQAICLDHVAMSRENEFLPGVMGGVADRHSKPAARISENTSPSQPCLTPSMPSPAKKSWRGVGIISHVDGGLLTVLPDEDRGGVAGANE